MGVNFLVVGYAAASGGLSFDSSVPVTDAQIKTSNLVLAYARVLDLWGMSGKFDAIVPYTLARRNGRSSGRAGGAQHRRLRQSALRLSVNFYGAPALTLKEFAGYQQDLIVGASLRVFAPWASTTRAA